MEVNVSTTEIHGGLFAKNTSKNELFLAECVQWA